MAVASGPAGPVLAGPVLTGAFTPAHAQVINNGALAWEMQQSGEQSTGAATRQSHTRQC